MFKHILLASDGSEASRHAAHMDVGLARAHAARLTAVFVVDPYPYLGLGQTNPLGFQATWPKRKPMPPKCTPRLRPCAARKRLA